MRMDTNSHLNRYMIILSHQNADVLESTTSNTVLALRPICQQIQPILPHLICIQTAVHMGVVAALLTDKIPLEMEWVLIPSACRIEATFGSR